MTLHHRSWGVYYNEVSPLGWAQARQRPATAGDNLNLVFQHEAVARKWAMMLLFASSRRPYSRHPPCFLFA